MSLPYCCSECGDKAIVRISTNVTSYTTYWFHADGRTEIDADEVEVTPDTLTRWECRSCGLILPCETEAEVLAYIKGA